MAHVPPPRKDDHVYLGVGNLLHLASLGLPVQAAIEATRGEKGSGNVLGWLVQCAAAVLASFALVPMRQDLVVPLTVPGGPAVVVARRPKPRIVEDVHGKRLRERVHRGRAVAHG